MKGLTSQEAHMLLQQHGRNILIKPKRKNWFRKLWEQLNNFLIYLLLFAASLSFLVGEHIEGVLILVIVILNAFFGLFQEKKAEEAIALLEKMSVVTVRILRDGKEQEIDSTLLVPGDIVNLEEGGKIPADGRIIEAKTIELNESILTGESLPIPKESKDEIYMGTVVVKGHGFMRVEKTGMQTHFGNITKHLSEVEEIKTPLQKKLEHMSKLIGIVGILLAGIVFVLSFVQGDGGYLAFLLAISLAVAIVPEGLPAVMTVTLSIGLKSLAKRNAIVRKLSAIETLGNVTLIATDKTGTLTTNRMTVKEIYTENEKDIATLLLNGILCSTASLVKIHDHGSYDILGDPTEGAILLYAQEQGHDIELLRKEWKIIDERPFDSINKNMSVKVKKGNVEHVFVKGAPETVLTPSLQKNISKKLNDWTEKGYRVLAFTEGKTLPAGRQGFLGIVAIYDPPRKEASEAIDKARKAGVEVVMITGDSEKTAESIGEQIGLLREGEEILIGAQIDQYSDEELLEKLPRIRIFARTTPIHKRRIVLLYQMLGETVAVTGDGVNDIVALKQANVGIAMGIEGTDVARETADIVLADDNFATIVNAIEEGRNIVQKLSNAVKYLLTTNLTEASALVIGMFVGFSNIFYPLQLLYINLISDGLPAIALAFSPSDTSLMKGKPEKATIPLLDRFDLNFMFFVGLFGALTVLSSYAFFITFYDGMSKTAAFSILAMTQSFVFGEIWLIHRNLFANLNLLKSTMFWVAFLSPFILQFIIVKVEGLSTIFKVEHISNPTFFLFLAISAFASVGIWIFKKLYRSP